MEYTFSDLWQRSGLSIDHLAEILDRSPRSLHRYNKGEVQPSKTILQTLLKIVQEQSSAKDNSSFKFIDLFAGIGGLRMGFESIGGECVFTSEWNKYSQHSYAANFDCDHEIAGNIEEVHEASIPEHDVLLAGFPCQPFSIAGVSKKNSLNLPHGFQCETQGNLFFEIVRILKYHQPRAFLLENVKNLVSHDKGRTFQVIHHMLTEELGYQVDYKVIDAKSWVPQHRERIFIVGFRYPNTFDFDGFTFADPHKGPKLGTILHPQDGSEDLDEYNADYISGKKGHVLPKYTLSDKLWNYLQAYAEKHRKKGNGFGFSVFDKNDVARTLSARYYKDGSEILIKQRGKNPRRLTPRECARLMGFDRPGHKPFAIPVSDNQAYRQFGNAVVVPVVESIAKYMAPWLVTNQDHAVLNHQNNLFANA